MNDIKDFLSQSFPYKCPDCGFVRGISAKDTNRKLSCEKCGAKFLVELNFSSDIDDDFRIEIEEHLKNFKVQ